MDAVNVEIFKFVGPAMPYVIGAYAVLWAGLMAYVSAVLVRLGKLERQLALVEETVAKRG